MFEILPETDRSKIGIRVTGKLSTADYERFGALLAERVASEGTLRLLIEMHEFEGWESLAAMWEDLKLDVKYHSDIERIAMVGEKGWQEWMTQLSKPFLPGKIRYFDVKEKQQAVGWLNAA